MRSFLTLTLVLLSARLVGETALELPTATIAHFGNLKVPLQSDRAERITLAFEATNENARLELEWDRAGGRIRAIQGSGAFPPGFRDAIRWESIPAGFPLETLRAGIVLTLKFRPTYWAIFAGNHRLAEMPAPLALPLRVRLPAGAKADEDEGGMRFQRTDEILFTDSFMRPEDPEDPQAALGEWQVVSGSWKLHTVSETAQELGQVRGGGRRMLQPEFSPNFYSLAGWGAPAVLMAGYPFYDDYSFESAVRLDPGEMGLVFYYDETSATGWGFTVEVDEEPSKARLWLWQGVVTNPAQRTVLAAASVETGAGQWALLRVTIANDRVQCFFDQTLAFKRRIVLPPGGAFALFARSENPLRFDDIQVRSNHDLLFDHAAELQRWLRRQEGDWFGPTRWWQRRPDPALLREVTAAAAGSPQWMAVGSPWASLAVVEEEFEPEQTDTWAGLLWGWTEKANPYFRFVRQLEPRSELFRLERIEGEKVQVLEEFRVTAPPGETPPRRARLMLDATRPGEWRLYRDGVLVLVHHGAPAAIGAFGPWSDGQGRVKAGLPRHRSGREDLYQNRYEKNDRFATDPFMRHWASPEGQWLEERDKRIWYTGDFFGRFALRMPYVNGGEIHLGVPEGASEGEWVVVLGENRVALRRGGASEQRTAASEASAEGLEQDDGLSWLTVQYDGYWLWAESGDRVLFKKGLLKPIRGRRIRVAGYTTEQLKRSLVERFLCKDFLFTESLYEWEIHGGRWEVINRFQCDPRWSHLNGESTNGPAFLWAKYELQGDFCVEMYAGQRHGWYDRCGDLNMTVLNNGPTPAEGYTLCSTAWDPDHSQLYTILYRNGREIARSDQYLVPRRREGNRRLGYEPLVAPGRDVHGAWYYLKLRRIGRLLEFYFDNDLVFAVTDEAPLPSGRAGIWTFLNSMMVARVKLSAETIRPRNAVIHPFNPDLPPAPASQPRPTGVLPLLAGGRPLARCGETEWQAADPVGQLALEWSGSGESGSFFRAMARKGASSMTVRSTLSALPLARCAGWRFEMKRTATALLDFHFSVGRAGSDGHFVPERRFVYRLSGPGGVKGGPVEAGGIALPPVSSSVWAEADAGWTPVTVWIPRDRVGPGDDRLVRVEGFGLMGPSVELQGVTGNRPGDGFAVRHFSEILYSEGPMLTASPGVPEFGTFSLVDWKSGAALGECQGLAGLRQWIAGRQEAGFTAILIRHLVRGRSEATVPLAWIRLPPEPPVSFQWSEEVPDAVRMTTGADYPDPRFLTASLRFGDMALRTRTLDVASRLAPIPRQEKCRGETLTVTLRGQSWEKQGVLAWRKALKRGAPALIRLEGSVPAMQNFEAREPLDDESDPATDERARLLWIGADFGRCLEVRNTMSDKRLRAVLPAAFSLARHPLFQFIYWSQDPMARVSLSLGGGRLVFLSEPHGQAVPVRLAEPILSDGQWRAWLGLIADGAGTRPFSTRALLVQDPEIGSFHPIDQTGLFSFWRLDELVIGPAVSSVRPLTVTPFYFDFEEGIDVRAAVGGGPRPWLSRSASERNALAWQTITNGTPYRPDLSALEDGVHHLFLMARNRRGVESPVTDIPFLLDRKPLRVSAAITSTEGDLRNQAEWRIIFGHEEGAPVDPESLRIFCDEHEVVADGQSGRLTIQAETSVLSFTWPWLFRLPLNQATNGQTLKLSLRGVQDGAGNRSPNVVTEWRVDYERDRVPPTLLAVEMPTNVFWRTAWEIPTERNPLFAPRGQTQLAVQRATNEPAYLIARGNRESGVLLRFESNPYSLERFPFLAFQMRRPRLDDADDDETITLAIEMASGQTLTLPLTARGGKKWAGIPEPPVWTSNRWTTLTFTLSDLVQLHLPPTNELGRLVRGLSLRAIQKEGEVVFHLRSLYLYGAGGEKDGVRIQAYDASGMAPPSWTYEDGNGNSLGSGRPESRAGDSVWVIATVTDKAGNTAWPIQFPFWGTHPPVKQEGAP